MFSQKNAKIAGPPCKNYVVHLIICSRSQQPKLFFNGLAQWGWGFRGNSIVVVSGARAAINKASELLLLPPLRQYFVLPAPSTNMFKKINKNRYTNAESQTWNRTLFLLHSQNNLYFCGRRVFIAQPEWYLRVLAVLLSSALTLVCPEEMASVANLHMSWMGKMLQNIFYFKLQIKCLEVEQLPLSPWQCQHIPPPQSGALILELTLRHIPQSNNYAIFPLCSNGAFYFKKKGIAYWFQVTSVTNGHWSTSSDSRHSNDIGRCSRFYQQKRVQYGLEACQDKRVLCSGNGFQYCPLSTCQQIHSGTRPVYGRPWRVWEWQWCHQQPWCQGPSWCPCSDPSACSSEFCSNTNEKKKRF